MKLSKPQIMGIVATLAGALWTFVFVVTPLYSFVMRPELDAILALYMMLGPGWLGILSLYYGFKVYRNIDNTTITRSIGFVLLLLALCAAIQINAYRRSYFGEGNGSLSVLLAVSGLAIVVYVVIANNIRRSVGIQVKSLEGLFTKKFLVVFCVQLFFGTSELIQLCLPAKLRLDVDVDRYVVALYMGFGQVLPFVIAYKVYRYMLTKAGLAENTFESVEVKHA
ncbi:MAG: hypothetical protein HUU46_01600 [Candidatus Hydrogenedentes bacterium]|nr:hypothetical protein [Candidatus Hydrogenedentota bacterium]